VSDKIVVFVRPNIFMPSYKEVKSFDKGSSVADILDAINVKTGRPVVFINDETIKPSAYKNKIPEPTDIINIKYFPAGSSGQADWVGDKMQGWGSFFAVLGMGLLFINPLVGLGVMAIGAIAYGGASISYGIGSMHRARENSLAAANNRAKGNNLETLPALRGGKNQARPGGKVPVIFGKHLVTPFYAGPVYDVLSGTDGENQYLYQLFCFGIGKYRLKNIKIGESLLATNSAGVVTGAVAIDGVYSDITINVSQVGGSLTPSYYVYYLSKTVKQESIGIKLVYNEENWRAVQPNVSILSIRLELPGGLYELNSDGDKINHTVQYQIKYRLVGSGTAWGDCSGTGIISATKAKAKTLRYDHTIDIGVIGDYEIGIKRISADDADDFKGTSIIYWTNIISIVEKPTVNSDHDDKFTFLAVSIKATNQLSGIIDTLSAEVESYMLAYSGSGTGYAAWANAYTRNPAAAFVHALIGIANPRPVPTAKIDWARIEEWYQTCETKGWNCDLVISNGERTRDVLQKIVQTGRASLYLRDGYYSVVIDDTRTAITQHFSPRNVISFKWFKSFPDYPHALKINFISEDDGWSVSERIVYDDGYSSSNATEFRQIDMLGVTDPDLVWKHGRYLIAAAKLRPELYTIEVDPEAISCEAGDLVLLSHDAIAVGQISGRIDELVLDVSDNVTGLVLDEFVTMESGKTYGIRIRRGSDNESLIKAVTLAVGTTKTITLTTPIAAADAPEADDLWTFGETDIETKRCIVDWAESSEDMRIILHLIDEGAGIHTADSGEIPDYDSMISRPPQVTDYVDQEYIKNKFAELEEKTNGAVKGADFQGYPPDITSMAAIAVRDGVNLSIVAPASTEPAQGYVGYIVQRSQDSGSTWYDKDDAEDGVATVPPGPYSWLFSRSTDGYPEKTGDASPWIALSNYRFRVKGVNAAGVASENWTYSGAPNVDQYTSWLSGTPTNARGTSTQRAVVIRVDTLGTSVYGYAGCDVEVSKNSTNWYEPQSSLDVYASEDNWRQSDTENNFKRILETQYQTILPLEGQDDGLSENTTYYFRFRYVTDRVWAEGSPAGYADSNGLTAGPWTSAITVTATINNEEDIRTALRNAITAAPGLLASYSPEILKEYPTDTADYFNNNFTTADGWASDAGVCSVSVEDGDLKITYISGILGTYAYKSGYGSSNNGKLCRVKIHSANTIQNIKLTSASEVYTLVNYTLIDDNNAIANFIINTTFSYLVILVNHGIADTDNILLIDFIYIGDGDYLPGALRDLSGNGYDCNVYGSLPVGETLVRDGVTNYERTKNEVEMPDLFGYTEKWVVPNNVSAIQILFYAGTYNVDRIYIGRYQNTRRLDIYYTTGSGSAGINISDYFPSSDTEAVVPEIDFDFPNEKLYVYKNGLKVGDYDITGIIKPTTSYWYFGRNSASANYCSGTVSLRCLWKVIHTASEALAHYQNPYGAMPKVVLTEQLKALRAQVVEGNICALSGELDDDYNYRILANFSGMPAGRAVGENRFGTADKYEHFKPQAADTEEDPLLKILNGAYGLKIFGDKIQYNGVLKIEYGDTTIELNPIDAIFALYNVLFKSYQGQGVFRHALQIDAHNIDFLNSPVGDDEQLHGRIGRLGPYGPVLLDGPFETLIESTWSEENEINSAASVYPAYIELQNGERRIAYKRNSDGHIVERIYNFDTFAWGDESVVNDASSNAPTYIQLPSGELRIAYARNSDGYIVERIYNFNTSTWGNESPIGLANNPSSSAPSYIYLLSEELRIAYQRDSDDHIVERIYNFDTSTWGNEIDISDYASYSTSYVQLPSGEFRIAYHRILDGYIVERIYNFDTSTWGDEIPINYGAYPSYICLLSEELRIAYRRHTNYYIAECIYDFDTSAWGDETIINDENSNTPTYIQLSSGELRIAYSRNSDDYLIERRLQRYAQLGAGVIKSGSNPNGHYRLYSDGTLEMWKYIDSPVANANTPTDMPYTPYHIGSGYYDFGAVTMSYEPSYENGSAYEGWCYTDMLGTFSWYYYISVSQPIYLTFVGRWRP
jgi:hypothetical protein